MYVYWYNVLSLPVYMYSYFIYLYSFTYCQKPNVEKISFFIYLSIRFY